MCGCEFLQTRATNHDYYYRFFIMGRHFPIPTFLGGNVRSIGLFFQSPDLRRCQAGVVGRMDGYGGQCAEWAACSNQKSRLYLCCFPLSSSFIFSSLYYLLFLISFDTLLVTFFCCFFAVIFCFLLLFFCCSL